MLFKKLKELFKDYYWDFDMWSQSVLIDTHISDVKKQLPNYIKVDWEKPEKMGKGLLYPVIKIKGHPKSKSTDFLGFVNDLYAGHVFRK